MFRVPLGFISVLCGVLGMLVPTAREASGAMLGLEFEAGVSSTALRYDEKLWLWEDPSRRILFSVGAIKAISIGSTLALRTGLRFVRLGNHVDLNFGPGEFEITQNYLAVPALLAIRRSTGFGPYLAIGPELGVIVSGRSDTPATPTFAARSESITSDLDPLNLTGNAEIGMGFPLNQHAGRVALRYGLGLFGAAKKDRWYSDWKTESVEALVGFRW